jgi:hypothetical protein
MSRKPMPDMMGSLLGGKPTGKEERKPEAVKEPEPAKTGGKQGGQAVEWDKDSPRRKATFNLSDQVQRELERLWMRIRVDQETPTSKSEIVEIALQLVMEEIEAKGEKAALIKRLSGEPRRT